MELNIVWRSPIPPPETEQRIEAIAVDEFGALYAVRTVDKVEAHELIFGGAA